MGTAEAGEKNHHDTAPPELLEEHQRQSRVLALIWEQFDLSTTAVVTLSSPAAAPPLSIGCSYHRLWNPGGSTRSCARLQPWHGTGLLQTESDREVLGLTHTESQNLPLQDALKVTGK